MDKEDHNIRRPPATTPEGREQQLTALAMDAIEKIARLNESKAIFKDEYKKKMKSNLDICNYCFLLSHRD
jgi:hypothetical protein